jgi:uncharacterized protein (DUF1501 family)
MPPDHESRPEQRHQDFNLLKSAIVNVAQDLATKMIWAMAAATFAVCAVGFKSWLTQRDLVTAQESMARQVASLAQSLKEHQGKQEPYNEKTSIMWHQGEWYKKMKGTTE